MVRIKKHEACKTFTSHSLQMFEEKVRICDEGLKKVCDEGTVGRGEEICKTHYETTCETRLDKLTALQIFLSLNGVIAI